VVLNNRYSITTFALETKKHTAGLPVRPILAIAISLMVCGLVGGYQAFVDSLPTSNVTEFITKPATGDYAIEVTLSFDARGDAFDSTALLVRLDGKDLLEKTTPLPAGTPVRIHPVEGLIVGVNELFIQVGTGEGAAEPHAEESAPFAEAGFGEEESGLDEFGLPAEPDATSSNETAGIGLAKAIRVRVFDGDAVLVEKTVWSEPGETISSTIVVDVPENQQPLSEQSDDHVGHNH